MKKSFAIIIIILAILLAGTGGFLVWRQYLIAQLPTISQNETANWKSYNNPNFGFEFKYPDDWTVDMCGTDNIIYLNPVASQCQEHTPYEVSGFGSITVHSNDNYNYNAVIADLRRPEMKKEEIDEEGVTVANSIPAVKFVFNAPLGRLESVESYDYDIVFTQGNYTYVASTNDSWHKDDNLRLLIKILSTFKLTSQN